MQMYKKQNTDSILLKIHGKVYDLKDFDHPGGKKFLELAAMTPDATPLFESHHLDSEKLKQTVLPKYEVKGAQSEQIFAPESWTEGFYPEFKKEVKEWLSNNKELVEHEVKRYRVWMYISLFVYYSMIAVILYSENTFLNILCALLHGFLKPILTGYGHNYAHRDHPLGIFFAYAHANLRQWEYDHNFSHHPFTNTKYDIDCVNLSKLYNFPRPMRLFIMALKLLFFNTIIRCFFWFNFTRKEYVANWLIANLEIMTFMYFGKMRYLFVGIFIGLIYFLMIDFSNHYIDPVKYQDEPMYKDWATQQIITSCDLYVLDYAFYDSIFAIGLGFQTAHHLLPKVDHCLLPHITTIMMRMCRKYNIPVHKPNFLFHNFGPIMHFIHKKSLKH